MDLSTTYLGMPLRSPITVGACPLTSSVKGVKACAAAGAAAVTLPSLFEEQIRAEIASLDASLAAEAEMHSEVWEYVQAGISMQYGARDYLQLIQECKLAVTIPVIASLNCISDKWWQDFACEIEAAGADALELNIAIMPESMAVSSDQIEQRYVQIVHEARQAVSLPLVVKIGPYFTSLPEMILKLKHAGADGFVLFNRFYRPTIDLQTLRIKSDCPGSSGYDLSTALRALSLIAGHLPVNLAAAGGVADGDDVVRALLTGADVCQSVTCLLRHGIEHINRMTEQLRQWMTSKQIAGIGECRGLLSQARNSQGRLFNRTQYIQGLNKTATTWLS